MTNISIPLHLFVKFKDLHGEALAQEYFDVYDKSLQNLNEEVRKEVLFRKAELKDELLHELITKGEFRSEIKEVKAESKEQKSELKAEINELRTELNEFKAEVRAEFKIMRFTNYTIIALLLVFIGTSNPTFVELVKALLK